MKAELLLQAMSGLDDELILAARTPPRRVHWVRYAAAACLCLVLAAAALTLRPRTPALDTRDMPPHVEWDGRTYIVSSYLAMEPALPAGYAYVGESENGPFYASARTPEWVYVWQEVYTDGTVDESGTLNPAPPHHEYVRYVDSRLRGRDLICREGRLYEPLLGAEDYPDLLDAYGPRIEGALPAGFVSLGTAAFSGLDTVPDGILSCNTGSAEIFADPADDRVLLLPAVWHTAPQNDGEVEHHGFTVYVPCVDKAFLGMVE